MSLKSKIFEIYVSIILCRKKKQAMPVTDYGLCSRLADRGCIVWLYGFTKKQNKQY